MPHKKKTIGILGGMGPQATLDFMQLILKLTPISSEQDHIPVIVNSNPNMPSRTRAYLFGEEDPTPHLILGIDALIAAKAEFIVVPCNSAHYFLQELATTFNIPFINMVTETAKTVSSMGHKKVGILAGEVTVGARLYEHAFGDEVTVVHVNDDEQAVVRTIIEAVKIGNVSKEAIKAYQSLLATLANKGCEVVILGCTELQAVNRVEQDILPVVDSLEVLAQCAIRHAQA